MAEDPVSPFHGLARETEMYWDVNLERAWYAYKYRNAIIHVLELTLVRCRGVNEFKEKNGVRVVARQTGCSDYAERGTRNRKTFVARVGQTSRRAFRLPRESVVEKMRRPVRSNEKCV